MKNNKYYIFGNSGYILGSFEGKFSAYEYQTRELIASFCLLDVTSANVICNMSKKSDSIFEQEAVLLMSEVLYFIGEKSRNVVFISDKNNTPDKVITCSEFERERTKKVKTIDELYYYPHLVPWNLVECEYDVLSLIEKYIQTNEKILEIGSGFGKNLWALKDMGYDNTFGIESSARAVELSHCIHEIKDKILCASATRLPFENNSIDCILDIGCLHCMGKAERELAIKESYRCLKRGGYIISRAFKRKDSEWIKKYPINVNCFGYEKIEYEQTFANYFQIIQFFEENHNGCFYYVGRKF